MRAIREPSYSYRNITLGRAFGYQISNGWAAIGRETRLPRLRWAATLNRLVDIHSMKCILCRYLTVNGSRCGRTRFLPGLQQRFEGLSSEPRKRDALLLSSEFFPSAHPQCSSYPDPYTSCQNPQHWKGQSPSWRGFESLERRIFGLKQHDSRRHTNRKHCFEANYTHSSNVDVMFAFLELKCPLCETC